jgi:hypothetical protein
MPNIKGSGWMPKKDRGNVERIKGKRRGALTRSRKGRGKEKRGTPNGSRGCGKNKD